MYGNLTLTASLANGIAARHELFSATRQEAIKLFNHTLAQARQSWWQRLTGQPVQTLLAVTPETGQQPRRSTTLRTVALDNIIGSEGRSEQFDTHFRPLSAHTRERWVSVATAFLDGTVLPPVELVETTAGFVVRDGNHRISVARAVGQRTIEAYITQH